MTCKHWSDEELIDMILGKLDSSKSAEIKYSITHCSHCQAQFQSWNEMLMNNEVAEPSYKLKKKVLKRFKKEVVQNEIYRKQPFKWNAKSILVMSMIIFFIMIGLYGTNQLEFNPARKQPYFVMENDTEMYELTPNVNHKLEGYAWVNNRTNEMYIFMDGLSHSNEKDYQAWIKSGSHVKDVGVLQLYNGRGELYLKDSPIETAEYIMVSVEPKGGSNQPTSENPYLIKLSTKE